AKLAWFLVLQTSLGGGGVPPDVLPASAVLAAMAVVGIIALVPITPGAVGVTEVAYIGILSTVGGPGLTEQITAGVMLFRIAQWLAVIPIGWVLLLIMRGGHLAELLGGDGETAAPATTTYTKRLAVALRLPAGRAHRGAGLARQPFAPSVLTVA